MIMDIGTEEIGHVEMLATMIARLLEASPVETREDMAKDSAIGAIMGGARIEDAIVAGMNPRHVIVTGSGAAPTDSVGYPWNARYTSRAAICSPTSASTSPPNHRAVCRSSGSIS
jgi:Mn-containing catalase